MRLSTIIALSLLLFSCSNGQDNHRDFSQYAEIKLIENESLESFTRNVLEHYQLPALAIASIGSDNITDFSVLGVNHSRGGVALADNAQFQIGSCGKSFTALLVACFVEQGLISWETKLTDVFQSFGVHPDYSEITIRSLLSHSSGMAQFWSDEEVFDLESVVPGLTGSIEEQRFQFSKWNLEQPQVFRTGEHHYSNAGYVVVACMLEVISEMSYEELIQQRVFNPLGLSTAVFGYPFVEDELQPWRHQHRDENGYGIPLSAHDRIIPQVFTPAGNISLSIQDLTRFLQFHQSALNGQDGFLKSSTVAELFKPVVRSEDGNEICMGWMKVNLDGIETYGHMGSDQTIRAGVVMAPDIEKAVVVLTNIGDQRADLATTNVIYEIITQ